VQLYFALQSPTTNCLVGACSKHEAPKFFLRFRVHSLEQKWKLGFG